MMVCIPGAVTTPNQHFTPPAAFVRCFNVLVVRQEIYHLFCNSLVSAGKHQKREDVEGRRDQVARLTRQTLALIDWWLGPRVRLKNLL